MSFEVPNLDNDDQSDAISQCLLGSSRTELVDLEQLRGYAWSKGGFLKPELRKMAWPKVLLLHEQIWRSLDSNNNNNNNKNEDVDEDDLTTTTSTLAASLPSTGNLQQLQKHVAQCQWKVQDHLQLAHETSVASSFSASSSLPSSSLSDSQNQITTTPQNASSPARTLSTKASTKQQQEQQHDPPSPDDSISQLSSSDVEGGEEVSTITPDRSLDDYMDEGESSCSGGSSISVEEDQHEKLVKEAATPHPGRCATPQEYRVLSNILLALLRRCNNASRGAVLENNDARHYRYHHYEGLEDVAALVLMNLQSASLTSLALEKLARHHLRPMLLGRVADWVDTVLVDLLQALDPELCHHLRRQPKRVWTSCQSTVTRWIQTWFARDLTEFALVARLMDVLLVSPPEMPLYIAVALLNVHRQELLRCDTSAAALVRMMEGLPTELAQHPRGAQRLETIIQLAQQTLPFHPVTAINGPKQQQQQQQREQSCWWTVSSAPTDYALAQGPLLPTDHFHDAQQEEEQATSRLGPLWEQVSHSMGAYLEAVTKTTTTTTSRSLFDIDESMMPGTEYGVSGSTWTKNRAVVMSAAGVVALGGSTALLWSSQSPQRGLEPPPLAAVPQETEAQPSKQRKWWKPRPRAMKQQPKQQQQQQQRKWWKPPARDCASLSAPQLEWNGEGVDAAFFDLDC